MRTPQKICYEFHLFRNEELILLKESGKFDSLVNKKEELHKMMLTCHKKRIKKADAFFISKVYNGVEYTPPIISEASLDLNR